jgi:hypothetical protein|tara:strand:- start:5 stop:190 length:186 start_codon:yes stop_codon:yes gene_type:complete
VNKVYLNSATIKNIKHAIAVMGHKRTFTNAYLSQNKCIKNAIINPALRNIKNNIKDHLSIP